MENRKRHSSEQIFSRIMLIIFKLSISFFHTACEITNPRYFALHKLNREHKIAYINCTVRHSEKILGGGSIHFLSHFKFTVGIIKVMCMCALGDPPGGGLEYSLSPSPKKRKTVKEREKRSIGKPSLSGFSYPC